jgi:hypothetical protein
MLPQWSFCQLLMSQISVYLAGRVRYSKVKRRSVDGSTVNAYIILSKYKKISISGEQIILREPEKSPMLRTALLIVACRQRADVA